MKAFSKMVALFCVCLVLASCQTTVIPAEESASINAWAEQDAQSDNSTAPPRPVRLNQNRLLTGLPVNH